MRLALELERLAPIYQALVAGKWPNGMPTPSEWHQQRLTLLVKTLGIRQLLPFLLAAAASGTVDLIATLESLERAEFVALYLSRQPDPMGREELRTRWPHVLQLPGYG